MTTMAMINPVDMNSTPFPRGEYSGSLPLRRAAPNDRASMTPDAPAFDLQSHSTQSDGSLAPAEVVARPPPRASSCSR